jgi:hypothetical protein
MQEVMPNSIQDSISRGFVKLNAITCLTQGPSQLPLHHLSQRSQWHDARPANGRAPCYDIGVEKSFNALTCGF